MTTQTDSTSPPRTTPDTQRLVAILARQPHIRMAILFGSAVAGSQGPESDIDIAIDIDRSLEIGDYLALLAELAEATGRPVDLVDLAKVGEPLLGQIITHGRQILGERQRFAQMLTRHLMDEADFLSYRNRILRERRQAWIGK